MIPHITPRRGIRDISCTRARPLASGICRTTWTRQPDTIKGMYACAWSGGF